ncbi:MAG: hypothetical protein E7241_00065 [Lachnospiraceae bacterium]|nr:hypothetical protein [Lachnospiraceae bacterium]
MNTMKHIKRIIIVAALLTGIFALTGCSSKDNPQKVSLVVIGGPRSNMNQFSTDIASVNELLYEASYSYGNVTFINCDGQPHVYASVDIPKPSVDGMDSAALKKRASDYTQQLKQLLSQGTAKYPESDLLSALQLASQAFASADKDSKCVLVILDSGLSTAKLDFRQMLTTGSNGQPQYMLSANPNSIVEELKGASELPKLDSVQVYFSYCGVTAKPQEPLSEKQKEKLKNIWKTVLISSGASEVKFTNDFATEIPYSGLPEVSTVPVERMTINPDAEVIETVVLDEMSVRFIGDTAEYVDVSAAENTLKAMAEQLLSSPDRSVYLVGTTATGRPDFTKDLSERRAATVRRTLNKFGVPEERMIAVGLGCSNYWHVKDTDGNGNLIEEYACKNRTVRIIDTQSSDAEKIHNS